MLRRKAEMVRGKQGRILGQKITYEPVEEGKIITQWRFRKKRQLRRSVSEGLWEYRYFTDAYKFFRQLIEHQIKGVETKASIQFDENTFWVEIKDIFKWLTELPQRGGQSREAWKDLIDTVKTGLGIIPSSSIHRWRIKVWRKYNQTHRKGWAWGNHQFLQKDFNAFRRYLRLSEKAKEGEVVELTAQLVEGGPYHKIENLQALLEPESKWGRSREYWKNTIDQATLAATGKPLDIDTKPKIYDPYEEEPSSIEEVVFKLSDVPEGWEVELSDRFVEELGKANQPWKYTDPPKKRGPNVYWEARTPFFKRLWGYHRYHKRGKPVDTGAFITKQQIAELRSGVIITDHELEKAVIGFKKGGASKPLRTRLPIHANRWWAKLFGFYYSSGSIRRRIRKGKYTEIVFRICVHEDVVPLVMQAARAVGGDPIVQSYVPVYTKGVSTGLGTTVKPVVLLSRGVYHVMRKMGLHLEFEKEEMQGRTASSNIKPVIPAWIKKNEDCMHSFVEAFINGSKGQSTMVVNERGHAKYVMLHVLIRMVGRPREYVERFLLDVQKWFKEHRVTGYFRELMRYDGVESTSWKFEFSLHNVKSYKWLLENFDIVRSDLRARLYSRVEAENNYHLYEMLRALKTPDNVVLGMLYEQPRSKEEVSTSLQMKEEGVCNSLLTLQKRGMVTKRGSHYYYDPEVFIERRIKNNKKQSRILSRRIERFSARLLHQCKECRRVYIIQRTTCGVCGGEVKEVLRKEVLRRISNERKYIKMKTFRLTTKETEGLFKEVRKI